MGKTKKAAASKTTASQRPPAEHPLLEEFAADVPHEAASGEYSFCVRDRWHGQPTDLADGWHQAGEDWHIRIEGGLPRDALRRDHPTAQLMDFQFS